MAKHLVRFLAGNYPWPWLRQTPGNDGVFGDSQFLFGDGPEPADWLVVYDELPAGYDKVWDPARTLFVASEPVNVKRYHDKFLAQFGTVLTTDRRSRHANLIYSQAALPWHVGVQVGQADAYDQAIRFAQFEKRPPVKTRLCSVICSNKTISAQHRQRLNFVQALKQALGDRIDVYGRGFVDMTDKDQALGPYRYHIALENCDFDDYWTEKLADPLLRGCYPIYWGSKNIEKYFSPDTMARIDINNHQEAIEIIRQVIDSDADVVAANALASAKRQVLWEHNLFALLDRTVDALGEKAMASQQSCHLLPESVFNTPSLARRGIQKMRHVISKLTSRTP